MNGEGTLRLIAGYLKDNPAYLLLLAIGILGGGMGVITTILGTYKGNSTLQMRLWHSRVYSLFFDL